MPIHPIYFCGHKIALSRSFKNGEKIPQHRLLTRKEWNWIYTNHRYSYWATTGPKIDADGNTCLMHHSCFWINPKTSRAIKHPEAK